MKPFLIHNWKTYIISAGDAVALADALSETDTAEVVVCPSALHTLTIAESVRRKKIALGAQDISTSAENPRTGNIAGAQLHEAGVSHVIVGHAETRAAGVTNAMVADKVSHALMSDLIPIVCLSEQDENEQGDGEEVAQQLEEIIQQNKEGLQKNGSRQHCIIAYEPTQHIGARDALAPEKIKQVTEHIRTTLSQHAMPNTPILYGGAVNPENAEGILEIAGVNGFLLGRASTNADTANAILHSL
ncbi:MAG: triose-phosphate isomerase [Candidatus Kaiserbacteria bacterium]|nr:triose-phosphate isomerase [Candidatus Kaiserbacteria bacterium]